MRPRWAPQSSKLLICRKADGRFDSDTFPRHARLLPGLLLTVALTWAQQPPPPSFWTGYDWNKVESSVVTPDQIRLVKRAYLHGVLDARYYYFLRSLSVTGGEAEEVFKDYLDRFHTDELIRGLDAFYGDPINYSLPVVSGMMLTTLRAAGFPDSTVQMYRQAAADWIAYLEAMMLHMVPPVPEGISRPLFPLPPDSLYVPVTPTEPKRWYEPDTLRLP